MTPTIVDLMRDLRQLTTHIHQLTDRVAILELQNLNPRLERAEELAERRADDTDNRFRRAFNQIAQVGAS